MTQTAGGETEQVDAKTDALRQLVAVCSAVGVFRAQLAQLVDVQRPAAVRRAVEAGWGLRELAEAQARLLVELEQPGSVVSQETLKADLRVARARS